MTTRDWILEFTGNTTGILRPGLTRLLFSTLLINMNTEHLRALWAEAIHLSEIEPNREEAIQFVKKHEDFSLFDSMNDTTLLVTFTGLVVFEKKYHLKYGSTTPASHCYMRLLERVHRGILDKEFIYDVGDWSAEYSDNEYIPMDNYRGLGPRAYYAFLDEHYARMNAEIEQSKARKEKKLAEGRKKVELANEAHQQRLDTIGRLKKLPVEEGIRTIISEGKCAYYYYELIEWWLTNNMLDDTQLKQILAILPEKSTKHNMRLRKHLMGLSQD